MAAPVTLIEPDVKIFSNGEILRENAVIFSINGEEIQIELCSMEKLLIRYGLAVILCDRKKSCYFFPGVCLLLLTVYVSSRHLLLMLSIYESENIFRQKS